MARQKSGHIINTSSVAGHLIFPASAVYSGTKFAVRAISEGLRQEAKDHNIRTTILSPSAVKTELLDHISDQKAQAANRDFVESVGSRPTVLPGWRRSRSARRKRSTSTRSYSARPPSRCEARRIVWLGRATSCR